MTGLICSFIISFAMAICLCIYYATADIKAGKNVSEKLSALVKRTKQEYAIMVIVVVAMMVVWIIGQYVYNQEDVFHTFKWQIAMGTVIPVAIIDFKEKIIPNKLLIIGLLFTVIVIMFQTIVSPDYIISIVGNSFIGMLAGGGVFFIASLFVRGGIGAGDIKMFAVLGLLLSFRGIFNLLLYSMIVSAIYSIVLLIIKKKSIKDELPLAPFALVGTIVSVLLGV